MLNYVGKFIPHLASASELLRKLTKKNVKFVWERDQEEAFKKFKSLLISAPVLGYYEQEDETQLYCDASPTGLGAVLIQLND